MDYSEQSEKARRAIENWPEWMKQNSYFVGSDSAPLPDISEDYEISR